MECLDRPIKSDWKAWKLNGDVAGMIKEWDHMTFVTAKGCGHMIPYVNVSSRNPCRQACMVLSWLVLERQKNMALVDIFDDLRTCCWDVLTPLGGRLYCPEVGYAIMQNWINGTWA